MRRCLLCGKKPLPGTPLCEDCIAEVDLRTVAKFRRMAKLLDLLEQNGRMTVKDLAIELKLHKRTIENYLKYLEKKKLVQRGKVLKRTWITVWELA